jgi:NAD(P)-dependent dehydrogenase (short-subunit alcohol dehydrogenase family)
MARDREVALITGAASGMGRLAARNLSKAGAAVAALDMNEAGLGEIAAGCDGIRTWTVDVADLRGLEAIVREIDAELGPVGHPSRRYPAAGRRSVRKTGHEDHTRLCTLPDSG